MRFATRPYTAAELAGPRAEATSAGFTSRTTPAIFPARSGTFRSATIAPRVSTVALAPRSFVRVNAVTASPPGVSPNGELETAAIRRDETRMRHKTNSEGSERMGRHMQRVYLPRSKAVLRGRFCLGMFL